MSSELLYLSNADVRDLQISPREAREAVLAAFRDNAAGASVGLPKSTITIGPSSWFSSMSSASEINGLATSKWVAAIPVDGHPDRSTVNGLICVSDYKTGVPVAVLDGNSITLMRTAAISASAALYLAPKTPASIGLVGCGLQALSHIEAFVDLFPSLRRVHLLSRSIRSAERAAIEVSQKKLDPIITHDPDVLLRQSEIVVSMVPSSSGLKSFLDARLLPNPCFVSAVDGGRSWRPETLDAFNAFITDSLEQSSAPVDASDRYIESVKFQDDLVHLALHSSQRVVPIRVFFGFRGFAIADLALAELSLRKARALGIGRILPR
ncbi:ornithine cyclodeaminase family protein [Bradyrhizobium sp. 151]|uniref:ornithine cyclodeaminase family protein n=1 Tax=Bradyrhizobium sp. 151 TaxID=2782626 RepID=UPI001FF97C1E|nr:ornithine cyclodeaminase family protein [Bradyrhizobium sp. 151]MCK1661249.1 ornithine cyclodeaminase family protein [Bradyrhizobium sp. 151]